MSVQACNCIVVVDELEGGRFEVLCGCLALTVPREQGFGADCLDCLAGNHKNNADSLIWDRERSVPISNFERRVN